MKSKLCMNDEDKLNTSIPYYRLVLTKKQVKQIEGLKVELINLDKNYLFPVKNRKDEFTSELIIYIGFSPK